MYFWWIFNFFPIKTGNGHSTTGIQIIRRFYVFFSGTGNFETRSPDPDPTILKVLDPDKPYMNADPPIPGANKKVHTLLYMYPVQREGTAARGCQVWYGNRIISTDAEWQMLPRRLLVQYRIQALCAFQFCNSGTTGNYVCLT